MLFLIIFSLYLFTQKGAAQVSITTLQSYIQNFDILPSSGNVAWSNHATLPGWHLPTGTSQLTADNGSASRAGSYSYGSTGAADRALGANKTTTYKLVLKNNTGGVLRHFRVRYRMEFWRKTINNNFDTNIKTVKFSYAQAPKIEPNAGYTETSVPQLDAGVQSNSPEGPLDGNTEFVEKEFLVQFINLPAGNEILFTWESPQTTWGLALDDVVIEPTNTTIYYNKNLTSLASLSNWGTQPDGSGIQPESFTDADQEFRIANYTGDTSFNLPGNWAVGGTNAKIVLGNGTTAATMGLLNDHSMATTTVDVADKATFAINAKTLPLLGTLHAGSTVIFEKEAPADITGSLFGTLVLSSGKQSKLARKVKIKGSLLLQDAKLELGNYDLELDYGATIQSSSAESYVVVNGQGRLRQAIRAGQELAMPVGNATYNPVKIRLAAGSQDDVFSVSVLDGVYNAYTNDVPDLSTPLLSKTINKTWLISEDVKGGSDIALTLTWSLTDALTGFDPANCHIKHYEYGAWDDFSAGTATPGVSLTGTTFSITRSGITSFSPFTVSSKEPVVLPVELLQFEARAPEDRTVVLNWATVMEQNNDFFAIEASEDGRHFRQIGQVKGAGDSRSIRHYSFTHRPGTSATIYYRLKQTDLDEAFTYSRVVAVAAQPKPAARLNVFPNPGKGRYYISTNGDAASILASVCDASGKQIRATQPLNFSEGKYLLDLSSQNAGIYLLHLITNNSRQVLRLIKD